MAPLRLDHVAHPCFDAAATVRFYVDVLALPLVFAMPVGDALLFVFGLSQGAGLAFQTRSERPPAPPSQPSTEPRHVGLTVADAAALGACKARLVEHGVPFSAVDAGEDERVYFVDPNGLVLELEVHHAAAPSGAARAIVEDWLHSR